MSIAAVTAYAELKQGTARAPAGTNADEGAGKKELSRITAYVPTEAVAAYTALLGIFSPDKGWHRWTLFGVVAALAAFLCWYFWDSAKTQLPRRALWLSIAFALIGLTAWAGALPDSPLYSIPDYSTKVGGAAVIILAPVIPRLAERFGVAPARE